MTTLVLPGLHGSGPQHWQSWWLRTEPGARFVDQDDFAAPRLEAWIARLAKAVAEAPGALIVAHSLGCALLAHVAARRPDLAIGGALLVAPADVDDPSWTPAPVAAFAPMPLAPFAFPAMVVASRDDPYVAFARARFFATAWRARLIDLGKSGHINAQSGFGPWPEGVKLAEGLIAPPAVTRLRRTGSAG